MQQYADKLRQIFIDPTVTSESTPLPEFKLTHTISDAEYDQMQNSRLERSSNFYFKRSEHFFTINYGALAKNQNRSDTDLPITMHKNFSLVEHAQVVSDHSALYAKNSAKLIKIDQAICSAILLAMIIPTVPFIPFVGLVAFAAWSAALYLLALRNDVYNDYQDSLILLVATCNWTLGSRNRQNSSADLVKAPVIANGKDGMMDLLYPVLSKTQVSHLIADDIEKHFTEALEARDSRFKFFSGNPTSRAATIINQELEKTALKQRGAEFIRCAYGLNRGTAPDFLRLLVNAIPDLVRLGYNAGKSYFTTPTETTVRNMSA